MSVRDFPPGPKTVIVDPDRPTKKAKLVIQHIFFDEHTLKMYPGKEFIFIKVRVILLKDTGTFTTYSKTLKEIGWGLLIYTSDTRRTTATVFHITFSVTLLQATVCSISRKTFQFHCLALLAISVKMLEL